MLKNHFCGFHLRTDICNWIWGKFGGLNNCHISTEHKNMSMQFIVFQFFFISEICYSRHFGWLKVQYTIQSCKSYNNKNMAASTQVAITEIFAFIAVLVFKLFSCKVLFMNRKDNRNCQEVGYFFKKLQISWAKFSRYFWDK